MNVLVTGGAGYIGSHCAHLLNDSGHNVTIIDNLSRGSRSALCPAAHFYEGCVSDSELVSKIIKEQKIEAVIHFAAFIEVEESTQNPLLYYQNNTVNTIKLLETCQLLKVHKFIFSSTAAVYGSPKEVPIKETADKLPINPYVQSKWMSEQALYGLSQSYSKDLKAEDRFRYVALRYFNVAGASSQYPLGQISKKATHLIKIACEAAVQKRKGMMIFGEDYPTPDGTCVRDYIHVDDLARAHLSALNYLEQGGESDQFNCGYGHGYSVKEVLETFKLSTHTDFPVTVSDRRPGDPASLIAHADKIHTKLGWEPKYDNLNLICTSALNWEKTLNSNEQIIL